MRSIVRVKRGRDEVHRGDWIVVRKVGMAHPMAGEVVEMMQCIAPHSAFSYVRIWCRNCKQLEEEQWSGVLHAPSANNNARTMVVRFESMHVEAVVRSVRPSRDEFV